MITTKDIIIELLSKLPGECAWIDYKVQVYSKDKMSDAIKDSIAMLNSNEAFGKDKYLIFGVAEVESHNHHPVGLKSCFPDDADFQNLFDKIVPRPKIETAVVEVDRLSFGYFYIPKENNDRVYEVAVDYGNETTATVKQGQAFIRVGSSTRSVSPKEREDILIHKLSKGLGTPNSSILALRAIDEIELNKYTSREDNGTITFLSDNNNGRYSLGHSDKYFTINLYVTNTDKAHIRTSSGERIGYKNRFYDYENLGDMQSFDYSSFDRCLHKNEIALIINSSGNFACIQLLSAKSKSHGGEYDEVCFRYKLMV